MLATVSNCFLAMLKRAQMMLRSGVAIGICNVQEALPARHQIPSQRLTAVSTEQSGLATLP